MNRRAEQGLVFDKMIDNKIMNLFRFLFRISREGPRFREAVGNHFVIPDFVGPLWENLILNEPFLNSCRFAKFVIKKMIRTALRLRPKDRGRGLLLNLAQGEEEVGLGGVDIAEGLESGAIHTKELLF